ncbi:MAG: hypothetical protein ACRCX2_27580 [Paraclostridium sp.]
MTIGELAQVNLLDLHVFDVVVAIIFVALAWFFINIIKDMR